MRMPILAYIVDHDSACPLQQLMKKIYEDVSLDYGLNNSNEDDGDREALAMRIFKLNLNDGKAHHWVRVGGDSKYVKIFKKKLRLGSYVIAIENRYGFIGKIKCDYSAGCEKCRKLFMDGDILVKSMIVTKDFKIAEIVVAYKDKLNELVRDGFTIIDRMYPADLNYILTPKQEEALYTAYCMGYYEYPKKANLSLVSNRLKISRSTLCEALNKAEKKVIDAYIKHNFPHRIAGKWIRLLKLDERIRVFGDS